MQSLLWNRKQSVKWIVLTIAMVMLFPCVAYADPPGGRVLDAEQFQAENNIPPVDIQDEQEDYYDENGNHMQSVQAEVTLKSDPAAAEKWNGLNTISESEKANQPGEQGKAEEDVNCKL